MRLAPQWKKRAPRCAPQPLHTCRSASCEFSQLFDPIVGVRMGGKEASSATCSPAHPLECVDQDLFAISGTLENCDAMAISGVFFPPAVAARDEITCDRSDRAAPGQ